MTFVTNISYPPQDFEQSLFLFLQDLIGPVRKFPLSSSFFKGPRRSLPVFIATNDDFYEVSFFSFPFFAVGKCGKRGSRLLNSNGKSVLRRTKNSYSSLFLFEWTFLGGRNDGSMYDLEAFIFFVRIFVFLEVSYQRQNSRVKVLGE